jgi:hypothetical protein
MSAMLLMPSLSRNAGTAASMAFTTCGMICSTPHR